jgi:NAD(P)H dehydrogenase (quinone)
MRIYILLAHPDKDSLNGAFADAYEDAAQAIGHDIRRQNLGDMTFDPVLWKGDKQVQELESNLKQAQENITWCQHWVIFYPIWWGSVPALFKGFIDRTLYSGFAYKYHDNDPFWDKLLKGRSAQIFTTSDAPGYWIRFQYRNSDVNTVKRATLQFCGVNPVKVTRFSRARWADEKKRKEWIKTVRNSVPKLD